MGRQKKGSIGQAQLKNERFTIRIDGDLRRRLETFSDSNPYKGEELQVVIRMLVRIGIEVEEKVKEMRATAIREISLKTITHVVPDKRTLPHN